VRPKPKRRRRLRRLLIGGGIVTSVVVIVRSPIRTKITERLFGPPPEDEPGSITLPRTETEESSSESIEIRAEAAPPPPAPTASPTNGVSSPATSEPADTSRT
jgi:hypothetical protein